MAKGLRDILLAIHISASLSLERHMGKEYTLGKMEKSMMVNGTKA